VILTTGGDRGLSASSGVQWMRCSPECSCHFQGEVSHSRFSTASFTKHSGEWCCFVLLYRYLLYG